MKLQFTTWPSMCGKSDPPSFWHSRRCAGHSLSDSSALRPTLVKRSTSPSSTSYTRSWLAFCPLSGCLEVEAGHANARGYSWRRAINLPLAFHWDTVIASASPGNLSACFLVWPLALAHSVLPWPHSSNNVCKPQCRFTPKHSSYNLSHSAQKLASKPLLPNPGQPHTCVSSQV